MSKKQAPSKEPEKERYRILLLTIWQGKDQRWRFVVEDPRSGDREGFADVDALIDGLWQMISLPHDSARPPAAESSRQCIQ